MAVLNAACYTNYTKHKSNFPALQEYLCEKGIPDASLLEQYDDNEGLLSEPGDGARMSFIWTERKDRNYLNN